MSSWWWRYGLAVVTLALATLAVEALAGPAVPLRVPLHEFPARLSSWTGWVEPMDPEFLQRVHPDEVLNRRYTGQSGRVISLYVGYYARQASRGQVRAVCQRECETVSSGTEVLDVQGATITVNRALIRQVGRLIFVLYWYQQGGRVIHDPHRAKLDQARRALSDRRSEGALVRVAAPMVDTQDEARERSIAFVKELFPLLRRHLPE